MMFVYLNCSNFSCAKTYYANQQTQLVAYRGSNGGTGFISGIPVAESPTFPTVQQITSSTPLQLSCNACINLESEKYELHRKLDESYREIRRITEEIKHKEAEIRLLTEQSTESNNLLQFFANLLGINKNHTELKHKLRSKISECDKLKEENYSFYAQIETYKHSLNESSEELNRIKACNEQYNVRIKELDRKLTTDSESYQNLKQQNRELNKKLTEYEKNIYKLIADCKEKDSRVQEAQEIIHKLQSDLKNADTGRLNFEAQVFLEGTGIMARQSQQNTQMSILQKQKQELEKRCDKLNSMLQTQDEALKSKESTIELQKELLADKDMQIAKLRSRK